MTVDNCNIKVLHGHIIKVNYNNSCVHHNVNCAIKVLYYDIIMTHLDTAIPTMNSKASLGHYNITWFHHNTLIFHRSAAS